MPKLLRYHDAWKQSQSHPTIYFQTYRKFESVHCISNVTLFELYLQPRLSQFKYTWCQRKMSKLTLQKKSRRKSAINRIGQ